jgi:hypothetical protein
MSARDHAKLAKINCNPLVTFTRQKIAVSKLTDAFDLS